MLRDQTCSRNKLEEALRVGGFRVRRPLCKREILAQRPQRCGLRAVVGLRRVLVCYVRICRMPRTLRLRCFMTLAPLRGGHVSRRPKAKPRQERAAAGGLTASRTCSIGTASCTDFGGQVAPSLPTSTLYAPPNGESHPQAASPMTKAQRACFSYQACRLLHAGMDERAS